MNSTLILDEKYSTTRLITQEKTEIITNPEDKFTKAFETVLFLPMGENRNGEGGLRTKGYFKKSYEDKPLISIITVVFNGERFLEETIQSVINQTYDNVEYIIIDGGSTDGTLDIIKKYEGQIDYWVSERDKGIYDAMNKGIDVASGEWINFMNAGDWFYTLDMLENIFGLYSFKDLDILYGDCEVNYSDFYRLVKAKSLACVWKGMAFSHQSAFIRTAFHKLHKYSLAYKICSDFDLFLFAYNNNHRFKYINNVVSCVSIAGLSDSNHLKVNKEKYAIVQKDGFKIKYYVYYQIMFFLIIFKNIIKFLLGKNISCIIKKLK